MKTNKNHKKGNILFLLASVLVLLVTCPAAASEKHELPNGITVNIYSAQEIQAQPSLTGIELSTGDREYFPFDQNLVVQALADMHGFQTSVEVDVFILPAPAAQVASSYAKGSAIYLAPGIGQVAASTVAYITTHEMGHVLTWAFMDGDSSRWSAYMDLRGLDADTNGSSAHHADRAREIVAEDFRHLFGGSLATISGSIENHDLTLPETVFGLEELLVDFLMGRAPVVRAISSSAFPNPCNPRTTVAMNISAGSAVDAGSAVLRVFDIRGALVRTIEGGQLVSDQVQIQWNGDNNLGSAVASGRYLYAMQVGNLKATGSVSLVR